MALLFKSTKMLESQIDEFLDAVSQGSLVFKEAIKHYMEDEQNKFAENIRTAKTLENKADDLRRQVESHLYTHSLIPEQRGDVLALLESMDDVIDTTKDTLIGFSIETPAIHAELIDDFQDLAEKATQGAECTVLACRAFFRDVNAVKDHLHKVYFYEKEADKIAESLKRHIFRLSIELSQKIHLTHFVQHVDLLADRAEDVADRLTIYTIKRSV